MSVTILCLGLPLRVRTLSDGPVGSVVLETEIHSNVGKYFTEFVRLGKQREVGSPAEAYGKS
jgi:hypothetical protein